MAVGLAGTDNELALADNTEGINLGLWDAKC